MRLASVLTQLLLCIASVSGKLSNRKFPDDFMFGTATSATQVEGAWNIDGKCSSMWDYFVHTRPEAIIDKSNANIACASFFKIKEDVQLLKQLGVNFYRFSISWSRILPNGFKNFINEKGIHYYSNLIDELIRNQITPMVTMYHWELPQVLSEFGGFTNPDLVDWFKDYAEVLFKTFGDKVKYWTTFNEPRIMCDVGYGFGRHAPGIRKPGVANYICGHILLKAHAHAYKLCQTKFKHQHGRVGIVIDCQWFEPGTLDINDIEASKRQLDFDIGRFLHPLLSKTGDYPEVVKSRVDKRSKQEGFPRSRLPKFSNDEILLLQNSTDFLGINHYTAFLAFDKIEDSIGEPSHIKDTNVLSTQDSSWPSGGISMFKTVPWALRKVLQWLKRSYGDIDIYVTENGYADFGIIDDQERIRYIESYLSNILDSIYEDEIRIRGYSVWSFMDSFEWDKGYTVGFGLYSVNFSDPDRKRTPKKSVEFYSSVIKTRKLSSHTSNEFE